MKNNNDSLQNKFTAYLIRAIENKKKSYYKKKQHMKEMERQCLFGEDEKISEFENLYFYYLRDKQNEYSNKWEQMYRITSLIEDEELLNKIKGLKERERMILLSKIYGEFSFKEIGEKFNISAKQAEMSYYYVLRKLRKEIKKDGI